MNTTDLRKHLLDALTRILSEYSRWEPLTTFWGDPWEYLWSAVVEFEGPLKDAFQEEVREVLSLTEKPTSKTFTGLSAENNQKLFNRVFGLWNKDPKYQFTSADIDSCVRNGRGEVKVETLLQVLRVSLLATPDDYDFPISIGKIEKGAGMVAQEMLYWGCSSCSRQILFTLSSRFGRKSFREEDVIRAHCDCGETICPVRGVQYYLDYMVGRGILSHEKKENTYNIPWFWTLAY
jgi:hypothetical protein